MFWKEKTVEKPTQWPNLFIRLLVCLVQSHPNDHFLCRFFPQYFQVKSTQGFRLDGWTNEKTTNRYRSRWARVNFIFCSLVSFNDETIFVGISMKNLWFKILNTDSNLIVEVSWPPIELLTNRWEFHFLFQVTVPRFLLSIGHKRQGEHNFSVFSASKSPNTIRRPKWWDYFSRNLYEKPMIRNLLNWIRPVTQFSHGNCRANESLELTKSFSFISRLGAVRPREALCQQIMQVSCQRSEGLF